jgi:phosphonate transport system substrate-binding protein
VIVVLTLCAGCGRGANDAVSPARHAGWPDELIVAMGVNPEDTEEALLRNQPFIERLEQATGIPVKFFRGTSFSSVVEAMRARRVDAMQVGVFSYLLAEQEAGAEAIAVSITSRAEPAVYDARLRPEYNGLIVTKKGSGIESIADLRGRTLNFGDPAGTSDHLVPKTELLKSGIVPDKDVKTRFAGSHASAVLSVWHGTADAAATADAAIRGFAQGGQVDFCGFSEDTYGRAHTAADLRAVFDACPVGHLVAIHSAPIPGTPFALRGDLPHDLKETIRNTLLSTADDPEFIRAAKRWYMDPSRDLNLPDIFAYYDSMRELATLLDLDLHRPR